MDAKTIIEIVKSGGTLKNANMLELQLEGVTKGVIKQFLEGKITKEEANRLKDLAVKDYESRKKQFEFQESMFKRHIQNIKDTECLREELLKTLEKQELEKSLNIALEIIERTYGDDYTKRISEGMCGFN
ncbi:MAG: hypothetical protein IKE91_00420 [Clostridia bacterium]|nr:hypothetical protein [Clostridia bacterium]